MADKQQAIKLVKKEDVQFFLEMFEDIDVDFYQLLHESYIPSDIGSATYTYLPEKTLENLVTQLGERSCKEQFAYTVWIACRENYIPKFVAKLNNNGCVKALIEQSCLLLSDAKNSTELSLKFVGDKWWLVREKTFSEDIWFKYAEIFSVIFINELLYALIGKQWYMSEVAIRSADIEGFNLLPEFKTVQFYTQRSVTAVRIPEGLLETESRLAIQITTTLDSPEDNTDQSFVSLFKLAIHPYLSTGKLPIKWAAKILNMHVRTLQRRLVEEGTTYSELIEQMVLEQALYYLANSTLSITEIAAQMGYSEAAHFTRAFKRQMNMTPSQYRKLSRADNV